MTNRIKTIISCFLILLVLVGCKPQPVINGTPAAGQIKTAVSSPLKTPVPTPAPEIEADISKLKGLQIHFLHPWTGETAVEIAKMVDQFNQTNEWGIHVIVEAPGSAGMLTRQFWDGIQNDQPADVVAAPAGLYLSADQKLKNIVDLNPYVVSPKYGFSGEEVNDFLPAFWQEDQVDGKRIGIPAQRTMGVLFYNTTWAAELGISTALKTPVEFQKAVCAANASMKDDADRSNDGLGGWISNTDPLTMLSWLNSFNALPLQKPATTFTSKKSTAAFDYLLQLQKSSCAWNSRQAEPYDYFTARQALAYSGVMQDIMPQTAAFKRSANQDNWTLLAYPADGDQSVVTDGSSYAVVKSDAENQMASWLFIRWISTPQNQARILQTSGTLPLGSDVLSLLSDFKKQYPQWAGAAALEPLIQPTVRQANAEIIQMVLEDAGWQLFKTDLKTEQIPAVLIQLDEMIKELTGRNP